MARSSRNFQKLLLTLSSLAALLQAAPSTKNRAANYFPRGSGAILNMKSEQFVEAMNSEDQLMFIYVFDSEQEKSTQMNTQIISPMLEELKGYVKFLAFDCQNEEVKASDKFSQICQKDEYLPFFQLIKPAEIKINPYTNKPMQSASISYSDN